MDIPEGCNTNKHYLEVGIPSNIMIGGLLSQQSSLKNTIAKHI